MEGACCAALIVVYATSPLCCHSRPQRSWIRACDKQPARVQRYFIGCCALLTPLVLHGGGAGGAPRPYLWGTPVVAFHANFIATSDAKRECLNATGQWLQRPRPELCAVQSAVHRQRHRVRPVGRLQGVRFVVTSRGSLRCVGA